MSPENKATLSRFIGCDGDLGDFDLLADEVETIMNAVRAEERARAAEVVKPFAEAFRSLSSRWLDHEDHWADAITPPNVGDLRRAAAYITDSEGGA